MSGANPNPHGQSREKRGHLAVEREGGLWVRAWMVLRGNSMFQYATPASEQPTAGVVLTGCEATEDTPEHPRTAPRLHSFTIVTLRSPLGEPPVRWRLGAESSSECKAWVAAVLSVSSPPLPITEFNSVSSSSCCSRGEGGGPPPPAPAPSEDCESFWCGCFGRLEEVPWEHLCRCLSRCSVLEMGEEAEASVFCIANVLSQGAMGQGAIVTRSWFRLLHALFGPVREISLKCSDAVSRGYVHPELTSRESEDLLFASVVGSEESPKQGTFLLRFRKGARHQMATAWVDGQGIVRHTMILVSPAGKYSLQGAATEFRSLSDMVSTYEPRFRYPVRCDLLSLYGPRKTVVTAETSVQQQVLQLLGTEISQPSARSARSTTPPWKVGQKDMDREDSEREIRKPARSLASLRIPPPPECFPRTVSAAGNTGRPPAVHSPSPPLSPHTVLCPAISIAAVPPRHYLESLVSKLKDTVILSVSVPVLALERRMKLDCSLCCSDALVKMLRGAQVPHQDSLGLYFTDCGIWADLSRPLWSYMPLDDDKVEVLYQKERLPGDYSQCLSVQNGGKNEWVAVNTTTTAVGVVRSLEKGSASAMATMGLRLSRPGFAPFFCCPLIPLADYGITVGPDATDHAELCEMGREPLFLSPSQNPPKLLPELPSLPPSTSPKKTLPVPPTAPLVARPNSPKRTQPVHPAPAIVAQSSSPKWTPPTLPTPAPVAQRVASPKRPPQSMPTPSSVVAHPSSPKQTSPATAIAASPAPVAQQVTSPRRTLNPLPTSPVIVHSTSPKHTSPATATVPAPVSPASSTIPTLAPTSTKTITSNGGTSSSGGHHKLERAARSREHSLISAPAPSITSVSAKPPPFTPGPPPRVPQIVLVGPKCPAPAPPVTAPVVVPAPVPTVASPTQVPSPAPKIVPRAPRPFCGYRPSPEKVTAQQPPPVVPRTENQSPVTIFGLHTPSPRPESPPTVVPQQQGETAPSTPGLKKWVGDIVTLQGWWASLTAESRRRPEMVAEAATRAGSTFSQLATTDTESVQRLDLLDRELSKPQLVTLVDCLSSVLLHRPNN